MPNNSSPVMDQFDRLLFQESHHFTNKTPQSLTSVAGAPVATGTQFQPLAQPRPSIDALYGVLSTNAAVRRQLKHDIVRVALSSSGIVPHHGIPEDEINRILEVVAAELTRSSGSSASCCIPLTPVEDRATIPNELVWSALREAPPGIDSIQRPSNAAAADASSFNLFQLHRAASTADQMQRRRPPHVTQPTPLKVLSRMKTLSCSSAAAQQGPGVGIQMMRASTGSQSVTRSKSSAFSEYSSGSVDEGSSNAGNSGAATTYSTHKDK